MARARNIKPALFKNEVLGEADPLLTILFQGLWCLADRDGKLEDRSKRIKAEIFPYRELPDFNGYLTELARLGFIDRYSAENTAIIRILNFAKHQSPHKTERASDLPDRPENTGAECNVPLDNGSLTVKESLIPDSLVLIPDSVKDLCPDPPKEALANPDPVLITIPTNKFSTENQEFEVRESFVLQMGELYPAVNTEQELKSIRGWSITNQPKRKTMSGMPKFINAWFSREQDRGGSNAQNRPGSNSSQNQPKLTPAQRIAETRRRLAAESPDLGAMAKDGGDVRPRLDFGAGRGSQ